MSSEAIAWAFKQPIKHASAKFVLIALAECANYKTGKIFPSLAHLEEIAPLNRKTIIAQIDWLVAEGYLLDTGEREGRTKQIKVYSINIERVPETEPSQKRNSSNSSVKQSQKRYTEPSREPSPLVSSSDDTPPVVEKPVLKPEHVVEAWNDLAQRRGLPKVKALTGVRAKKLRSLIRAHPIEDFTEAISAIERSPFLLGQKDGGWRANFDFLLQPSSFVKLIEGNYDRAH